MDTIRSWIFKGRDKIYVENGADDQNRNEEVVIKDVLSNNPMFTSALKSKKEQDDLSDQGGQIAVTATVDPKVAEYFKYFPEPYKTKAIIRFSSREGLYQWDFYRDYQMRREFQSAMRGEFLEDKRDMARQLEENEKKIQDEMILEKRQTLLTREQSALEKAIRTRIPVHEDETLGLKLFQATNFSLLGVVLLWSAFMLRKRRPTIPKWQHYMTMVGSSYLCAYLHIAAVYRLMDWGVFDRRVDNRDAFTKQFEEVKNVVLSFKSDFSQNKENDEP